MIFSDVRHVSETGVINLNINDHMPVFLIKKKARNDKGLIEIRGRSYKYLDLDNFVTDVQEIELKEVFK